MWGAEAPGQQAIPNSLACSEQNAANRHEKELLVVRKASVPPQPCSTLPTTLPSLSEVPVSFPEQSYMLQDSVEHVQLFDLMRRMLEFDPAQRITLAEALLHPFFAGLTPEERSFHSSRNPSR